MSRGAGAPEPFPKESCGHTQEGAISAVSGFQPVKRRPGPTWNYNPQAPRAAARGPAARDKSATALLGGDRVSSTQEQPGGRGERGAADQRSEGRYAAQGSSGTVRATLPLWGR